MEIPQLKHYKKAVTLIGPNGEEQRGTLEFMGPSAVDARRTVCTVAVIAADGTTSSLPFFWDGSAFRSQTGGACTLRLTPRKNASG